ncbi:Down syndrome cell adhesion molecule-like protein Dscam2, partial [Hyalella azteca]|uniref:Down syndrome cell adhesion molecule-like protein Dscam2 n=1 Tax=Hyalella azteca TaxID=294128 RepID=A0A8B7P4U9_HYAAZ
GVQLPATHHQRVHANGTLTIAAVTRAGDEGSYSCTALDKQGRSDQQTLHIQVKVPPRLAHIYFVGENSAGLRTQAACLVLGGDTPITLTWFKDGTQLEQTSNVVITHVNEFTSLLAIEKTSGEDSGNYSCTASNSAMSTTVSAQLTVSVPPEWVQEPEDASVALGAALELPCSAKAFPRPSVSWRQQTPSGGWGAISQKYGDQDKQEAPYAVTTGDDSQRPYSGPYQSEGRSVLTIVRATRKHEGRYLCQASNNVGNELAKLVTITVLEPPWFPEGGRVTVEVEAGVAATLECRARGDAPLTVVWSYRGDAIVPSDKYKVQSVREELEEVSLLTVNAASSDDSGSYQCQASNVHGMNTYTVTLSVQDVPSPPTEVSLTEIGSRHVSVNWSTTASIAGTLTNYIVTYASDSNVAGEVRVAMPPARVDGLVPATGYLLRVAAENRVGRSEPSAGVRVVTLEEPPSGPPLNLKVSGRTSTSISLRWDPPQRNLSHGVILGYHLGSKENGFINGADVRPYNFTIVALPGPSQSYQELSIMATPGLSPPPASPEIDPTNLLLSSTMTLAPTVVGSVVEVTLAGLRPYTRYALVLRAFNSKGAGPSSAAVTTRTLED